MSRHTRSSAVLLISAGSLAYEVLLVRVLAIEHFHHFAYMAIGVAMLGFGAAGTLLTLLRLADPARRERWFAGAALLTPLALLASAALVHLVRLDATRLAWDLGSWPRLVAVYLLLALPFGVAGLAVLLALALEPERSGALYGASFAGSGIGAALSLAALWVFFPARALAVPALAASLGALSAAAAVPRDDWRRRSAGWITVLVALAALAWPPWRIVVTPYKGLPQVEAYPDAVREAERTSPLGWVVAVRAPAFRYAPGLSLAYHGAFPRQRALFVDGELAGAANEPAGATGGPAAAVGEPSRAAADQAILDWLPSAAAYALGARDTVLVIAAGEGTEVWNAVAHGARFVRGVELNPDLVELGGWGGAVPTNVAQARVAWSIGDARSYVARSRERFDLVTLGPGRPFGTSAAGVHALSEDFLHTVEAYEGYLSLLNDGGVLSITRWLTVPPRETVRVILTAAEALRRREPGGVTGGLVVMRSWATGTVLVKPSGFDADEVAQLAEWAETRSFDLDWYPGIGAPSSRFNFMDRPALYEAAAAAAVGPDSATAFARAYPFVVAPATDARPYPHHFLGRRSLGAFLAGGQGSWLPFAEWGYVALAATLIQSALVAALLLVLPVALRAGRSGGRGPGRGRLTSYFAAIGLGFLAAEVAAIQQLSLLLGHPVYAVAAVLAVFLLCSGAGSVRSDRWAAAMGRRSALALVALLALYAGLLLPLIHQLQPAPLWLRGLVALIALAPLAFVMGTPFPLGLRALARGDAAGIAWAWAANGFASVLAAPLAALVALETGAPALLALAAAAYAAAALAFRAPT